MAEEDLFLQEVTDEVKAERLRQWWQRFGSWVGVGCAALVLGTIAYQYHTNSVQEANEDVTSRLLSTTESATQPPHDSTIDTLSRLPENAGAVTLLARLKAGDAMQQAGKAEAAKHEFATVAKHTEHPALANYAQLRLGEFDKVKPDAPYAALANELRALELHSQGKKEEARKLLQSLADSPETPPQARNRARELIAAFQ